MTTNVPTSIEDAFLDAVQRYPDRTFLQTLSGNVERKISYAEAACRAAATVRKLHELGLKPGDRVVFYADEPDPLAIFILACSHAGLVQAPLGPTFSSNALEENFRRAGARYVFARAKDAHVPIGCGLPTLVFHDDGNAPDGAITIDAPSNDVQEAVRVLRSAASGHSPEDPYILFSTSGSTGVPKLAVRSYRAFTWGCEALGSAFIADRTQESRFLVVASWTHGLGQTVFGAAILVAGTLCAPGAIDTRASLADVRALRPNFVVLPPRVLRSLHDQYVALGGTGPVFDAATTVLRTGGAPADLALLDVIASQGVDVGETFGASESAMFIVTPSRGYRRGFVGKPVAGVELKFGDDGEFLLRSPGNMPGYYQDEQQTALAFTEDGFWRSGDLAELVDGYFRFVGRKKDIFNSSEGANIHPARIETVIERFPGVHQTALIGDQRPYIVALIVVDSPDAASSAELGFLNPEDHAASYRSVAKELSAMNATLEEFERVRRFFLFSAPMGADLHASTGSLAKRKVNRKGIQTAYAAFIGLLYESPHSACMAG
jgi:long-chain acyl-CoA synthetase